MIPARIANATFRLGAPKGWDEARDGVCAGLDVLVRDGTCTSCWEPTGDELERLAAGAVCPGILIACQRIGQSP